MIRVEVDGKKVLTHLRVASKATPDVTSKRLYAVLLDLAAESAKQAPIESGDLRDNCTAQIDGNTIYTGQVPTGGTPAPGTKLQGRVGYSLPYAIRQHEDLTLRHDRTDGHLRVVRHRNPDGTVHATVTSYNLVAGGNAKYLEGPYRGKKHQYIQYLKGIGVESIQRKG